MDIGSHALDLIDFLLGPLERVRASARGPAGQVETKVEMHFRIGKIDGTATWSFEASEAEETQPQLAEATSAAEDMAEGTGEETPPGAAPAGDPNAPRSASAAAFFPEPFFEPGGRPRPRPFTASAAAARDARGSSPSPSLGEPPPPERG